MSADDGVIKTLLALMTPFLLIFTTVTPNRGVYQYIAVKVLKPFVLTLLLASDYFKHVLKLIGKFIKDGAITLMGIRMVEIHKNDLAVGFIRLAFALVGILFTYFLGRFWLTLITSPLMTLTLLSIVEAIGIPIVLFLLWLVVIGVLSA